MSFNISKINNCMVFNKHNKWVCIILIFSILICSTSPIFALGPNSSISQVLQAFEAGKNVGEMFAMLMGWNQTGTTVEEAILISIAAELQYIFDNGYAYNVVNPYTGVSPTYYRSGARFGEMLADLNNSLASFGNRFMYNSSTGNSYLYDLYLLTGRMEIILGGANGNNITAINGQLSGIGQMLQGNTQNGYLADNIVPTLNSINSYINTVESNQLSIQSDLNNINWISKSCTFEFSNNGTDYYTFDNYPAGNNHNLYIKITGSIEPNVQLAHITLPFTILSTSNYSSTVIEYDSRRLMPSDYLLLNAYRNLELYLLPFDIYGTGQYNYIIHLYNADTYFSKSTNLNIGPLYDVLYSNQDDFYKVANVIYNQNIMNSLKYQYDGSNIVSAIDDISLTDNNFKLSVPFDLTLIPSINSGIQNIRDYFNTGVSVSTLFNTVDSVEDGWFTNENSVLINTLSGGYVDLYD